MEVIIREIQQVVRSSKTSRVLEMSNLPQLTGSVKSTQRRVVLWSEIASPTVTRMKCCFVTMGWYADALIWSGFSPKATEVCNLLQHRGEGNLPHKAGLLLVPPEMWQFAVRQSLTPYLQAACWNQGCRECLERGGQHLISYQRARWANQQAGVISPRRSRFRRSEHPGRGS